MTAPVPTMAPATLLAVLDDEIAKLTRPGFRWRTARTERLRQARDAVAALMDNNAELLARILRLLPHIDAERRANPAAITDDAPDDGAAMLQLGVIQSLVWHDGGRVSMTEADYHRLHKHGTDLLAVVVAAHRVTQSLSLRDVARLRAVINRIADANACPNAEAANG